MDNTQLIITLITAMGGIEGIKGLFSWYRLRQAQKRSAEAEATSVEVSNLGTVVQNLSTQLTQMNTRINERDQKIDEIYDKYRDEQEAHLKTLSQLRLEQMFRCEVPDCAKRQPPRIKLVDLLNRKPTDGLSN